METITFTVPNISCHHCVHTINMEVSQIEGVNSVVADVASKNVTITFETPATQEKIKALLAEINYPVVE